MHRSPSNSIVTEELFINTNTDKDHHELPTYDPASHVAKKERSRLRSAENAIHVIPLVLALCAIVLWFFSTPLGSQILSVKYLRINHMLDGIKFVGQVGAEFELKDFNPILFTSHLAKRPPHYLSRSIITELF
ncbi:hypothetical protein POTOM_013552 [Populus tomentosa]|uniref:Transmembrane protein n=1 Tax=Populus tomentosa TaxID=118781 RepID=A0A8X8D727_POPTO|nr:hypothetical protein POTOM_013552 [Populus tomentosa]